MLAPPNPPLEGMIQMSKQEKINYRLEQIEWAAKANGSHSKTITRMKDEYLKAA